MLAFLRLMYVSICINAETICVKILCTLESINEPHLRLAALYRAGSFMGRRDWRTHKRSFLLLANYNRVVTSLYESSSPVLLPERLAIACATYSPNRAPDVLNIPKNGALSLCQTSLHSSSSPQAKPSQHCHSSSLISDPPSQ